MPSVNSDVAAVSGAVPVPTAGAAALATEAGVAVEFDADDDDEADEEDALDDGLLLPLEPPLMEARAFCTAAVS